MLVNTPTRLGSFDIAVAPVPASPLQIVTLGAVLLRGREKLEAPTGAVLYPCGLGPKRKKRGMAVCKNAFLFLRGREGVTAYYGGEGRGKLYKTAELARKFVKDAETCDDPREKKRLSALAKIFAGRLYQTGRMVSRLELWQIALRLEFDENKRCLVALEHLLTRVATGVTTSYARIRNLSEAIRLAPFVCIHDGINILLVEAVSKTIPNGALNLARELIQEIHSYRRQIAFEEIIIGLKEPERMMFDKRRQFIFGDAERGWLRWVLSQALEKMDAFLVIPDARTEALEERYLAMRGNIERAGGLVTKGDWVGARELVQKTREEMKLVSESV